LNGSLSRRYAAALADVAIEQRDSAAVKSGLAAFVDVFFESEDLRNSLESPSLEPGTKRQVIEKIAERMDLPPAVRNFLWIIVDHRRTEMLREIESSFREELNARLGIAEAEVTSARSLNEAEKKELTAALERRTGKKIEANFREDKGLLGGAVARVGSTIYDGSVREQLERLRDQLETE
jgi:F-type H+-transporting ATPase subunit delta